MKIKLEFIFNNSQLFIDHDLPNLNHYIDNIVYSSSDLLVYNSSSLEILISKEGTVSIGSEMTNLAELKSKINLAYNEYKKLTSLSDFFKLENTFKLIVPNENTSEVADELGRLKFDVNIYPSRNTSMISVEKNIIN